MGRRTHPGTQPGAIQENRPAPVSTWASDKLPSPHMTSGHVRMFLAGMDDIEGSVAYITNGL